jgi:bifunctional non-homologous end joining protein LigD
MAIEEYRRKRDFSKTPEPAPAVRAAEGNSFVVHRHEARNLHYDLRIQAGGVLSSWAVPKGFSYDPSDKRLAVRTEDHPLEYVGFEGAIPRGQYGAGTMRIWDVGDYELRKEKNILKAMEKG